MSIERQLSQRKQVKSALERIETLEQTLPQITAGINGAFQQVEGKFAELAEILDALVDLTGKEQVDSQLKETRERKAQEAVEEAKAAIAAAVEAGRLQAAASIGGQTIVVGKESDKDGNVAAPGRIQLNMAQIKPEFQEKLLGQAPGFSFDLPTGGKFEVTEAYDFVAPVESTEAAPAETSAPVEA